MPVFPPPRVQISRNPAQSTCSMGLFFVGVTFGSKFSPRYFRSNFPTFFLGSIFQNLPGDFLNSFVKSCSMPFCVCAYVSPCFPLSFFADFVLKTKKTLLSAKDGDRGGPPVSSTAPTLIFPVSFLAITACVSHRHAPLTCRCFDFILFLQAMDARDVDFAAKSWRKMLSDLDLLPFTGCIVSSIVFHYHNYARQVQVDYLFE